jgi:hypothetical protein
MLSDINCPLTCHTCCVCECSRGLSEVTVVTEGPQVVHVDILQRVCGRRAVFREVCAKGLVHMPKDGPADHTPCVAGGIVAEGLGQPDGIVRGAIGVGGKEDHHDGAVSGAYSDPPVGSGYVLLEPFNGLVGEDLASGKEALAHVVQLGEQ